MDINPTALFSYLLDDLSACCPDVGSFSRLPNQDFWPGASPKEVQCLRLVNSFFKKLNDDISETADEDCLKKFLASDELCHRWALTLQDTREEELFNLLKQEVDLFLHPRGEPLVQSYFDLLGHGRAGPGASLGANGTDFYTKFFSSKLTATSSELYQLYNEYVQWFPDWVDAELSRSYNSGCLGLVRGNRLSFVRKTRDISRSICTEASLNMFFQLGLGEILAKRLRRFEWCTFEREYTTMIDLATQPERNRSLAWLGSTNDSIVTIDLESASDSFSTSLCREIFPNWFLDILMMLRSQEVELPGGVWHELGMISSMGNGFTFPLQTMLFTCVVRAAARFHNIKLCSVQPGKRMIPEKEFGVFGDDIACPREISDSVCRLLRIVGFRVNHTKSYFVGPFRESCGRDCYNGHDVRGVYIRSLKTQQDRYVAINLLNEWSALTGIYLPRSVGYLVDSVRHLAVPYWENDVAGIRVWTPPIGSWVKGRQWYNYRCCLPITPELIIGESGSLKPSRDARHMRLKSRQVNPSGLLLSFLGGFIRNCRVSIALKQGEKPRYRTSMKVAHRWDGFRAGSAFAANPAFWTSRVTGALRANLARE